MMKTRLRYTLALLVAVCTLWACAERESLVFPGPSERTLLYYLSGDAEQVGLRVDSLVNGWRQPKGHLLVFLDTVGGEAVLSEVVREAGVNRLETVEEYGSVNSATAAVLGRVVSRAHGLYTTSDFGLVVYSGTVRGWLYEEISASSRSVFTDGRETLGLKDFAAALPEKSCRFILFEDGYMAGVECAYELKDKTDYVVACSSSVPSPGLLPVYGTVLEQLMANPAGLEAAAAAWFDSALASSPGDSPSVGVSVIKTSALEPVRGVLQTMERRVTHWEWVSREGLQAMDRFAPYTLYYDACSYVQVHGTAQEYDTFRQAVSASVVYSAFSDNLASGGAPCGLTLYVPDGHYPALEELRKGLNLYE